MALLQAETCIYVLKKQCILSVNINVGLDYYYYYYYYYFWSRTEAVCQLQSNLDLFSV